MDFVVSKVAMSICALLAVSILAGVLDRSEVVDEASDLSGVVEELCGLVDRGVWSGTESIMEWTVPFLSDGGLITITITSGVVRGEAGGHTNAQQTTTPLHQWQYSGQALDSSLVEDLDETAGSLERVSGQGIMIRIVKVLFEDQPNLFAFVGL